MARRKNAGVLEGLFDIAATLPWWAGVLLAAVSYAFLHRLALAEVATAAAPGQIGQMVVGQFAKMLAYFGQYIVPLAFLGGTLASYMGRRKRTRLLMDVKGGQGTAAVRSMDWREFELLVGEAFREKGFAVVENGGGGADGGVDVKLRKGSESFLVQCKHWRAYKVSVTTVRELFGVMAATGASGGFVVTSGYFTDDAKEFARGRNIELIDGPTLSAMIAGVRNRPLTPPSAVAPAAPRSDTASQSPDVADSPFCPRCGSAMVKRLAKQGANAGNAFWGCETYPKCRGVRAID